MDVLTKEQRHKNMSNIKSKDTKIELKLRKALWHKGFRYRKNFNGLPGKPDIVLTKYKIVIFCDGEFFHGRDWNIRKEKMKSSNNGDYWIKKIDRNIERDSEVDKMLTALDWTVIHFWGKEILNDTDGCIKAIEDLIYSKKIEKDYIEENNYEEYV